MGYKSIWHLFQQSYRAGIRHPQYRWLVIVGTLLYFLNPLDISPDFLPGFGWIDDGLLAALFVAEVSQLFMAQSKASMNENASVEGSEIVIDVDAVSVSN